MGIGKEVPARVGILGADVLCETGSPHSLVIGLPTGASHVIARHCKDHIGCGRRQ
jgi:hypothetical protein